MSCNGRDRILDLARDVTVACMNFHAKHPGTDPAESRTALMLVFANSASCAEDPEDEIQHALQWLNSKEVRSMMSNCRSDWQQFKMEKNL